jgi:hypothetical protein
MKGEKTMNMKRFILTLVAVIAVVQMPVSNAQSEQSTSRADVGWAAIARGARADGQQSEPDQDTQAAAIRSQDTGSKKRIVGSWVITVSPVGAPVFSSLQTYSDDGTMTETSTDRAIGPAHGAWEGKKNDYAVTFELFAFNPSGEAVGRLRVRANIHLNNDDSLTGDGVVDFIQPDGTVIPNVAITPFTGTRIKVVPTN